MDAAKQPVIPLRAKVGYIEVERYDKAGRVRKAKDHIVPSEGMHSAKEMEHLMREVARDVGADESQIRVDVYKQGRAPLEVNPRHRGMATKLERHTGTVGPQPSHERRHWGGMPSTPEEWAAHVAAFYAKEESRE